MLACKHLHSSFYRNPFLSGPGPLLYTGFPGVRAYVRAYVRVRKLVEAELTMTMKVKVVSLDE